MTTLCLQSTPMVYVPGVLRWAMSGYKFKKDRAKLRSVVLSFEHPLLTKQVADDLLSGKLPYKIEGENVVIELAE